MTYSLSGSLSGDDSDKYEISESGQITAALGAVIDYEDSAGPSHFLTVTATDLYGAEDTIDVTITITDVNEAPIISGLESVQFLENDTHDVASYNAFDLEGDDVSWLALAGRDANYFILVDGRLRFKQLPDFEARNDSNYEVRLRASDGTFTGILNVTVNVQDVNEPPAMSGETDIAFPENSSNRVAIYNASDPEAPTNPVIWSLGGSDADQFELRGSSRGRRNLYFKSARNFEDRSDRNRDNEFEVTIEASDGRQRPSGLGSLQVAIDLTDLDEPESLMLSSDVPVQDVPLTATMTDADNVSSRRWQWARSTSRSSGWTDISGATSSTYQPVFDDIGYYLRVTVTYNDPHGTDKTLRAISDQSVIRNRGSNSPPKFPSSETGQRTIPENSGVGTRVTHPVPGENAAVVAEDEDDDQLIYSLSGLSGDDSDKYEISESGQITAALGAVIDYEDSAGPSHFLTVTATDLFGAQDTIDVTITITDVNEAPIISGRESVQFLENATRDVASYNTFDPEGDDVSWLALAGSDAQLFHTCRRDDSNSRSPPNYESRATIQTIRSGCAPPTARSRAYLT